MTCAVSCQCSGCFSVWALQPTEPTPTWVEIQDVLIWRVTGDIQQTQKRKTSTSFNVARKQCPDIIGYDASFDVEVCPDGNGEISQYCDLLGTQQQPGSGLCTWYFFGWDAEHASCDGVAGTPPTILPDPDVRDFSAVSGYTDGGWMIYGQVIPTGYEGDNNADAVATQQWALSIFGGPYLPAQTCA